MSPRVHRTIGVAAAALLLVAAFGALGVAASRAAAADEPVTVTWTEESPTTVPGAIHSAMTAYDATHHEVVLFGGTGPGGDLDDTWTWDGADWTLESPAHRPPARYGGTMAYDPTNGNVVMFGGGRSTAPAYVGDTWTWDGTDWTEHLPTTSPSARYGAGLAADHVTGSIILFGGQDGTDDDNETWRWDGTDWTLLAPATAPSPRYSAALSSDATTDEIVLFGGYDFSAATPVGETWTWNGSTWTQAMPATSPPALAFAAAGYDSAADRTFLVGGTDAVGNRSETWTWDGTTWTDATPSPHPSARNVAGGAYDVGHDEVVLFGGYGTAELDETWTARLQLPQTVVITSTPSGPARVGGSYHLAATGGASGNSVTYSVDPASTPGACTVSGSTLTFTGEGTCVIVASQAGSSTYLPATTAQQTITVGPAAVSTTAPTTGPSTTGDPNSPTTTAPAPGSELAFTGGGHHRGAAVALVLLGLGVVFRGALVLRRRT